MRVRRIINYTVPTYNNIQWATRAKYQGTRWPRQGRRITRARTWAGLWMHNDLNALRRVTSNTSSTQRPEGTSCQYFLVSNIKSFAESRHRSQLDRGRSILYALEVRRRACGCIIACFWPLFAADVMSGTCCISHGPTSLRRGVSSTSYKSRIFPSFAYELLHSLYNFLQSVIVFPIASHKISMKTWFLYNESASLQESSYSSQ